MVGGIHRVRDGEGEISIRVVNDMASLFEEREAFRAIMLTMGATFNRVSTYATERRWMVSYWGCVKRWFTLVRVRDTGGCRRRKLEIVE